LDVPKHLRGVEMFNKLNVRRICGGRMFFTTKEKKRRVLSSRVFRACVDGWGNALPAFLGESGDAAADIPEGFNVIPACTK
jgi:hypothetical protein